MTTKLLSFATALLLAGASGVCAQDALRLLNNPESDRTVTVAVGGTAKEGVDGRTSDSKSLSLGFFNPVDERISTTFGLSFTKASSTSLSVAGQTDTRALSGRIGLIARVGSNKTSLALIAFGNQLESDITSSGITSDTAVSGFAVGVSQPLPLGPNTFSGFALTYVGVPSEDTESLTFSTNISHRLDQDWTLQGGVSARWSNQSVNLDGDTEQQTLRLGAAYRVNKQVTIGVDTTYGLSQDGDDFGLRFVTRFKIPGAL
ncbi:hypothetical protein [Yoonia sp.]|uniref:hypothetical protein n=1 Tax=Yoonia sp. TaxID=2212373 RepID=UPI003F6C81A8